MPFLPPKKSREAYVQWSLEQTFVRVSFTFIRSPHGQQMSDCHILYRPFASFYFIFREIFQDSVIDAFYLPFVNGDACQQGNDALCGRHDMDTVIFLIPIPDVGIDLSVIPVRCRLAYIRLAVFYEVMQFGFRHLSPLQSVVFV